VSNDDIDRVLSSEDSIVPSSGFTASVMERVRRDAETPPPIPFPWKRALPGLVSGVGALAAFFSLGVTLPGSGAVVSKTVIRVVDMAKDAGFGWIAVALVVSLVSVAASLRLAGRRATG